MLTFRTYDDEARVITYYEPFAWLNWIFILFDKAIQSVRETVELAHQGRTRHIEFQCIKESFVPAGKLNAPFAHQTIQTTSLPPIVSRTRYEDMADYCESKAR